MFGNFSRETIVAMQGDWKNKHTKTKQTLLLLLFFNDNLTFAMNVPSLFNT